MIQTTPITTTNRMNKVKLEIQYNLLKEKKMQLM